jgi:protein gp37
VADRSHIEWTEATWNPLVGCTKVSPGCDHCYAETLVNRFAGTSKAFPHRFDVVTLRDDRMLTQPLRWARPRRIFVNSLSDLFHADVPDEFIARVFAVMAVTPRHTYQLLTKRPARMRGVLRSADFHGAVAEHVTDIIASTPSSLRRQINVGGEGWAAAAASDGGNLWLPSLPLPNVWLGVSVEDQHWADIRIPALLDTPAAIRWISAEPLLGPVDLGALGLCNHPWNYTEYGTHCSCGGNIVGPNDRCSRSLDWIVVGGESGKDARPMHPQWVCDLRGQCEDAGVPFLFKQWGEWAPGASGSDILDRPSRVAMVNTSGQRVPILDSTLSQVAPEWALMSRLGKKAAGRRLDGRTHDAYPTAAGAAA